MLRYLLRNSVDYLFSNWDINQEIQDDLEERYLDEGTKLLEGQRIGEPELQSVQTKNGRTLVRRSWSPPKDKEIIGLVYICHGFTEHMGNYNGVGEFLSDAGFRCFGTDWSVTD